MKLHFFWINACGDGPGEAALNALLAGSRVVNLEKHFCSENSVPGWAICVEVIPGPEKQPSKSTSQRIDYRQKLDSPTFAIFAELRAWRKKTAEREGVPVYAVFSNEQLAAMAQQRCSKRSDLNSIDGIGSSRIERYGEEVVLVIQEAIESISDDNKEGNAV